MSTDSTLCSCLPAASPDPELSPFGLYGPSSWLTMAYLGPYPTSWQSPQMRLLPHGSLHRPSSIVTMASLGPAPASQPSLQAQNFLKSTSQGPATASHQPPKGHLLPHSHLPTLSSCFTAQLLPPGGLYRPSSFSWLCLEAQLLPHNNLFCLDRPRSCLTLTSLCPAPASRRPLQAQLLPPTGCPGPKLAQVASSGTAPA
ncbi:putative uncharacterized protein FLJ92257 [Symphalangus syndactylus]|uniref:putative uncharacterized protein FLJ92257 n=1 Tax=Symphalangus syndactylus TaxID=9590 RepID=UPI0024419CB1|nr:putative uncharacterized protein FLJ92257 [Symphalangus syndactylus]